MQERSILERIEILEQRVESLMNLPTRVGAVESQIVQLRGEMRDGFHDLRSEMRALEERLVERITEGDEETRRYMRVLHEEVISRIESSSS